MLKDQIRADFMNARKTGDTARKNALEAVVAYIIAKEKTEAGHVVTDAEMYEGIAKEIKVQNEVREMWAGKNAEKEAEAAGKVAILTAYMPKQLTEEEVLALIKEADIYPDASPKTKGMIIKAVMPRIAGQFDKSKVNGLVESYLATK